MGRKTARTVNFFNNPDNYLQHRFAITLRMAAVRELLEDVPKNRLLDIGCGDGSISLQFLNEKSRLTLVDISERMLEASRSRTPQHLLGNLEFVRSSLEDYVPREKFEVVLGIGVLPHVADLRLALKKMAECTKPGGHCVLQITDWGSLVGKAVFYASNLRESIKKEYGYRFPKISTGMVREILSPLGFKLVRECRYWSPLPLMGRFLSHRILEKFGFWTMRTPWLSRRGSDAILMFRKNPS